MKWNRLARRGNPARRKRLVDRSRGIKCMVTIKRCEHEISARLANLHRFEGSKTLSVCLHQTGSKYFSVINAQTGFHGAVNWILIKIFALYEDFGVEVLFQVSVSPGNILMLENTNLNDIPIAQLIGRIPARELSASTTRQRIEKVFESPVDINPFSVPSSACSQPQSSPSNRTLDLHCSKILDT